MRMAQFTECGEPETVVRLVHGQQPIPLRGEVLVRMIASPINPSDLLYIQGQYGIRPELPSTPGFEGVGVVESHGGGVLGWLRKGKRVAVINDNKKLGNWSEYTIAKARQVVPVPDSIDDAQAASFFVNPATAIVLTQHLLKLKPGDWLLQTAANSNLGQMIIRMGKTNGFHTICVVRKAEQVDNLKRIGADVVIVDDGQPFAEQLLKSAQKPIPIKFAIDPVGGSLGTRVVEALSPQGRVVGYGLLSGEPIQIDPRQMISGSKSYEGFWLADWMKRQSIPTLLRLFRQIRREISSGVLRTEPGRSFSLEQLPDALHEACRPGTTGKILLRIAANPVA